MQTQNYSFNSWESKIFGFMFMIWFSIPQFVNYLSVERKFKT